MRKERFVCIEWEDASYTTGYYDPDDPKRFNPISSQTVGHLIKKDRQKILVGTEKFFLSDGTIDDRKIQTNHRKMVMRIRYLEDRK